MNDRDLYKAKRIDNKEWITGNYMYPNRIYDYISKIAYQIDSGTLCRCTGLEDKNGKLIWENDIVLCVYDGNENNYIVIWDYSELDFKATNGEENYGSHFEYLTCCEEIEILGNIFDNQELWRRLKIWM